MEKKIEAIEKKKIEAVGEKKGDTCMKFCLWPEKKLLKTEKKN